MEQQYVTKEVVTQEVIEDDNSKATMHARKVGAHSKVHICRVYGIEPTATYAERIRINYNQGRSRRTTPHEGQVGGHRPTCARQGLRTMKRDDRTRMHVT